MKSRHSRQSFLGEHSARTISDAKVAVVGLCGGGSHVAQQLAHIGIGRLVLVDHDHAEIHNLNRMVGLTHADATECALKGDVLERLVRAINPEICVETAKSQWQLVPDMLKDCTAIVGCVDSYAARDELERFARRYHIPYIDVGMDVHGEPGRYFVSGQIILSMPGAPCMRCMGFVNETLIAREAQQYGAAGGRPQVVWPNGVLASSAVGMLMSLLTPWNDQLAIPSLMEYDGNRMTVVPSAKVPHLKHIKCGHYVEASAFGDIDWKS